MTRDEIKNLIVRKALEYGIDPAWAIAQLTAESNLNPKAVGPPTRYGRAKGLAQFIDTTWAEWGRGSPFDPEAAVDAYMRYMKYLIGKFGSYELAAAAYNAGPGNVQRYGGIPPFKETQGYLERIKNLINTTTVSVARGDTITPKIEFVDDKTKLALGVAVLIVLWAILRG